ncbi:MAG: hypothetical protein ACK514_18725, partial [Bacteroidota bacterium]
FSEQAGFVLKKKRKAMSKLLSFFFREIKKKVSISYFSICCVRNLRPPGLKMCISDWYKVPIEISLAFIVLTLSMAVLASMVMQKKEAA